MSKTSTIDFQKYSSRTLAFAKNCCTISKDKINTVAHCCKSVLIYNNCAWSKKGMGNGFGTRSKVFMVQKYVNQQGYLYCMNLRREISLSRTSLKFIETMAQQLQKVSQVQLLSYLPFSNHYQSNNLKKSFFLSFLKFKTCNRTPNDLFFNLLF